MKVYFKLSEEGQKAELLKGNEVPTNQIVDVDFSTLTENQRKALTYQCCIYNNEMYFTKDRSVNGRRITINRWYDSKEVDSVDVVLEIERIFNKEQKLAEEKVKNDEHDRQQIEKIDKIISPFCTETIDIKRSTNNLNISVKGIKCSKCFESVDLLVDFVENHLQEFLDTYISEVDAIHAKKAARKQRSAAEKQRYDAEFAKTKAWGILHGSELLKLYIKNNKWWINLAREEFALSKLKGFSPKNMIVKNAYMEFPAVYPSLKQMMALEKAKSENAEFKVDLYTVNLKKDSPDKLYLRAAYQYTYHQELFYKELEDNDSNE
jgi:hypothetical protein